MAVKKRCGVLSCRQVLRPDGTCPNPKCVRYVPEEPAEEVNTTFERSKK